MLAGAIIQDPRYNFIYCYADTLPTEASIVINESQSPRTRLRYSSATNWNPSLQSQFQGLIGFSYEPNTFVFGDTFTVTSNTGNMPVSAYASATSSLLLYLDATVQQSYLGSGTTWKDLSRNGPRNCTLTNGPTFTTANNGAIVFDGVDDYVACGNLGGLPSQGTISYWMYSTAVENYRNPFSTAYLNGNACIRFEQYTTASPYGGFNVVIGNDQGTYAGYSYSPSAVLSANTWYNIALAWNTSSSSLSGYMDGILKFTTNTHTYWPSTLPSVTLGSGFDSGRYFKGRISGVQMWNRAITAPEVFQNYSFQKDQLGLGGQVITDSLISYLNISDSKSYPGSGSTITDLSNNANSATISGTPTFSNGVLTFNGVDQFAYLSNPGFFDSSGNSNYADVGYAWSVSIWFKFPVTPTTVRNSSNNGGNCSWSMIGRGGGIGGAETLALFVSSNDGSTSAGTLNPYFLVAGIRGAKTKISPGSVNNNTWYFVTLTWNGTAGRAYLNGEDRGPLNIGAAGIQTGVYFNVGSTASAPSAHGFEGSIGQVYTYNRAINFLEHLKNFYSGAIQYNWYISELITNGLVLSLDASYYLSYPGSGTTWTDTSGNNNTGTLTNGPTWSVTNGGYISFDGVDDYVSISNSTSLQVADSFTVCAWIYATNLSARFGIFTTRANNTAGCWQFEVGTGSSGTNRVLITGVGTWIAESVNNVISTNNWYFICVSKTNNATVGADLYVNGIKLTLSTSSAYTITNNTDEKRIGIGTGLGQYFPGYIGQLLMYNRALSTSEIVKNFNITKTRFGYTDGVVTSNLVTYLDANNIQSYPESGLTWFDISGNGNNVTAPSTVSLGTFGITRGFNLDAIGKYFQGTCINSIATSVTLEAWIYPAAAEVSSGDRGTVILLTGINGLYMSWNKSSQKMSNYWYGHPSEGYHENTAASSRSSWSHWCSVWNNADGKLYQYTNGVKAATDATTQGNALAGTNLIIGRESDDRQFAGGIAEIRIYSRALTQNEVLQNFNSTRFKFGI